jgi:hypothetical protein
MYHSRTRTRVINHATTCFLFITHVADVCLSETGVIHYAPTGTRCVVLQQSIHEEVGIMDARASRMQKRTITSFGVFPLLAVLLLVCLVIGTFVAYNTTIARNAQAKHMGIVKHLSQQTALMSSSITQGKAPFGGWNSAVVGVGNPGALPVLSVYNYDPVSGKRDVFVPQPPYLPLTTHIDGISSDGHNLLYQFSQSSHTLYYTLKPIGGTGFFYELNDANAGNAIWLPFSSEAFVLSLNNAVEEVDTLKGQSQSVVSLPIHNANGSQTQIGQLVFYHAGYLYFIGSSGFCEGTLCRVQPGVSNPMVQQISFRSSGASYWLGPDGQTIYFANKQGPAGEAALYAVNIDGSNLRVLRTFAQYPDATPIGYAADNSPVIMTMQSGQFEAVKIGATLAQDTVIQGDAAPGATSLCGPGVSNDTICDANIAFAPYGHALIVSGTYANGTQKVWSDDIAANKQCLLLDLPSKAQIVLPGWDLVAVV